MEKVMVNKTQVISSANTGPVLQQSFLNDEKLLDSLIFQNKAMITNVAKYLSGSEENIPLVIEEVFVRLYKEIALETGEAIDGIIHRLAYEVSLEFFMAKIQTPKTERDNCYDELREELAMISDEDLDQCLMYESEQDIAEIEAKLEASSYMINDIKCALTKKS